ncbi:hypothetical protein [Flaviaesturariibacter aridisoli]|uniref:Uncharacterized protein n=1 Tax=Flaviaesturariibacter aridisoli TaxID=2545761 RepID=A0A4V6P659_9BACT|nr:hypothetical protein [Flaviaesturariibacter aridisoli]TCZ68567.1 hypothetical protein E0486_13670 [Flaviaesturariibacter aridisoli]
MRLLFLCLLFPSALLAQSDPEPFFRGFFNALKARDSAALKRLFLTDAEQVGVWGPDTSWFQPIEGPAADTNSSAFRAAQVMMPGLPYFPATAYDSATWFDYRYDLRRDPRIAYPSLRGTIYFQVRDALQQLDINALWIDGRWKAGGTGIMGFVHDPALLQRRVLQQTAFDNDWNTVPGDAPPDTSVRIDFQPPPAGASARSGVPAKPRQKAPARSAARKPKG